MQFSALIRDGLAAHPDWLRTAMAAVTAGMADAIGAANKHAADSDLAWRLALTLVDPKRLTAETKEHVGALLVRHLKTTGATCGIEQTVLKHLSK